jgi:glycosyltransferase involved in cell wall biosynthesis
LPKPPISVSVIVPTYRSASTLPELMTRIEAALDSTLDEYEILIVNDGSPDETWSVLSDCISKHPRLRAIDLLRNYGQHNALLAGIRAAQGSVLVTMDDDLQHRPEEIPKLLQALTLDHDLVYGYAEQEEHEPWRNAASQLSKLSLAAVLGVEAARKASAFRAFRAELRHAFADNHDSAVALDVLLSWATTRVRAIPVRMDQRREGRSNYTIRTLGRHALNLVTGYSTAPLRLVTYVGIMMGLFGIAILTFVIGRFLLEGRAEPGFAFIASIVALFSGAQLAALGVLGEYLGRIHFRSMGRPAYAIRTELAMVEPRAST